MRTASGEWSEAARLAIPSRFAQMKRVRGPGASWRAILAVMFAATAFAVVAGQFYVHLAGLLTLAVATLAFTRSLLLGIWVARTGFVARSWLRTYHFGRHVRLSSAVYDGALFGDSIWRSGTFRMIRVTRAAEIWDLHFTLASPASVDRAIDDISRELGLPPRQPHSRRSR